jgi:hypothetical protein
MNGKWQKSIWHQPVLNKELIEVSAEFPIAKNSVISLKNSSIYFFKNESVNGTLVLKIKPKIKEK